MKISLVLLAVVPLLALLVPKASGNIPNVPRARPAPISRPKPLVPKPISIPKPLPKPTPIKLPTVNIPKPAPRPLAPIPVRPPKAKVPKANPKTNPAPKANPKANPKVPQNPTAPKTGKHHKAPKQPAQPTQPKTNPKVPKTNPKVNPKTNPNPKTPINPKAGPVSKTGNGIVDAASAWKGTPYSFGGGSLTGPSKASTGYGKDIAGFDCSSLSRYAVLKATGKTLPRTADEQYHSKQCRHVPYAQRQAGDLVFWSIGSHVHHVGIVADQGQMWHAPHHHEVVKKAPIFGNVKTKDGTMTRMGEVARCA